MLSLSKHTYRWRLSGRLAGLWLALACGALPVQAEVVFPPGLRVGIDPPPGMVLNRTTGRFEDEGRKASILILDLPGAAYGEMERAIFAEINAPGVTIERRESFPFNNGIGFFASVFLKVNGVEYKKWVMLASSAANPVTDLVSIVSMQVPKQALDAYPDPAVRAAFRSITFRPPPIEERISLLPFQLSEQSGFQITHVAPEGIVLTEGPADGGKRPEIAISAGIGEARTPDARANLSQQAFRSMPVRDVNIINSDAMRMGGLPGYEIRASAKTVNGDAITIVQWMRFTDGGFIRIVAGARTDQWDKYFPRFRAVRDGLALRGTRDVN